jgi:hypothetical protein
MKHRCQPTLLGAVVYLPTDALLGAIEPHRKVTSSWRLIWLMLLVNPTCLDHEPGADIACPSVEFCVMVWQLPGRG